MNPSYLDSAKNSDYLKYGRVVHMHRSTFILAAVAFLFAASTHVPAATVGLTGTVRDFNDTHPDFEGTIGVDPGIVQSMLGADGKPVYAGLAGNPTTTGQANFDQWYRDVAGVNLSAPLTITLDNAITPDPNVFTFLDSDFFPIDGQLFGNQGRSHNYQFTYELHSEFTYTGGETFILTGDDDLWLFINDQLVVDLGGVHGPLSGSVSLDSVAASIGISTGNAYDFDLFFGERHTTQSNFRIDTSIVLTQSAPEPGSLVLVGLGIAGIGWRTSKRARCSST
jgi:fibro-slime domain-containing protein